MAQTLEAEITDIVRNFVGKETKIVGETRIYQDLGIAGDDVDELLEEIQSKFGTSFREMDFDKYRPNDLDAFIDYITFKVGLGGKWTPFTVDHLAQVVKAGSWFDPQHK